MYLRASSPVRVYVWRGDVDGVVVVVVVIVVWWLWWLWWWVFCSCGSWRESEIINAAKITHDAHTPQDPNAPPPQYPPGFDYDNLRRIHYAFPTKFLSFRTVGTMLRSPPTPTALTTSTIIMQRRPDPTHLRALVWACGCVRGLVNSKLTPHLPVVPLAGSRLGTVP